MVCIINVNLDISRVLIKPKKYQGIDRVLTGNINCVNLYEGITLSD